jgi:hypothetical protein
MGTRFKGEIEDGAMPWLHRYLGTPVTTFILNLIYGSRFSDIHCGMRALTKDAFLRMKLSSQSWEYASEMVLKSVHLQLRTTEVPIRFLKDKPGRLSHHKRSGWFSPWAAAWINLKAMFIYGADFFLFRPGTLLLGLGLLLTLPLSFGPIQLGKVTLSLYSMLIGMTLTVLGLQSTYLGILARVFFDFEGTKTLRWKKIFSYTRTVIISAAVFIVGMLLLAGLVYYYVQNNFRLEQVPNPVGYLAVTGLLFMIASFMTFTFTLLLHAANLSLERSKA